jgi:hypothetical protein
MVFRSNLSGGSGDGDDSSSDLSPADNQDVLRTVAKQVDRKGRKQRLREQVAAQEEGFFPKDVAVAERGRRLVPQFKPSAKKRELREDTAEAAGPDFAPEDVITSPSGDYLEARLSEGARKREIREDVLAEAGEDFAPEDVVFKETDAGLQGGISEAARKRELREGVLEQAGPGFTLEDVTFQQSDDGLAAQIKPAARRREVREDVLAQAGDGFAAEDVTFEQTDQGLQGRISEQAQKRELRENVLAEAGEGFKPADVAFEQADSGLAARITPEAKRREVRQDVLEQAGEGFKPADVTFRQIEEGLKGQIKPSAKKRELREDVLEQAGDEFTASDITFSRADRGLQAQISATARLRELREDILDQAEDGFGPEDVTFEETQDRLQAQIERSARERELREDVLEQAGQQFAPGDMAVSQTADGLQAQISEQAQRREAREEIAGQLETRFQEQFPDREFQAAEEFELEQADGGGFRGKLTPEFQQTVEQRQRKQLRQEVASQVGERFTPEDVVIATTDEGFQGEISQAARRREAAEQIGQQFQSQLSDVVGDRELTPGEEFELRQTEDGFEAELTPEFQQTVQKRQREQLRQEVAEEAGGRFSPLDVNLTETEEGLRGGITENAQRREATEDIAGQLESQFSDRFPGREFERGDEFTLKEAEDGGFSGELTEDFRKTVQEQRRTELRQQVAEEAGERFSPQDVAIESADEGLRGGISEAAQRREASEQISGQLIEQFSDRFPDRTFERGDEFTLERTDDGGFRGRLTEEFQQSFKEQRRQEIRQDVASESGVFGPEDLVVQDGEVQVKRVPEGTGRVKGGQGVNVPRSINSQLQVPIAALGKGGDRKQHLEAISEGRLDPLEDDPFFAQETTNTVTGFTPTRRSGFTPEDEAPYVIKEGGLSHLYEKTQKEVPAPASEVEDPERPTIQEVQESIVRGQQTISDAAAVPDLPFRSVTIDGRTTESEILKEQEQELREEAAVEAGAEFSASDVRVDVQGRDRVARLKGDAIQRVQEQKVETALEGIGFEGVGTGTVTAPREATGQIRVQRQDEFVKSLGGGEASLAATGGTDISAAIQNARQVESDRQPVETASAINVEAVETIGEQRQAIERERAVAEARTSGAAAATSSLPNKIERQFEAETGAELERGEDFTLNQEDLRTGPIQSRAEEQTSIELTEAGAESIQGQQSEQFGDLPIIIGARTGGGAAPASRRSEPGKGRRVESILEDASESFTAAISDDTSDTAQAKAVGLKIEGQEELANTVQAIEQGTRDAAQIFNVPETALGIKEAGEFVGFGVSEAAKGQGQEFVDESITAGQEAVSSAVEFASENPVRAGTAAVGSVALSAGAISGASRVSRPAGRGAAFAIQPGEELAGIGGFRVTRGLRGERAAQRLFPNKEPLIFSEEAAIRAGKQAVGRGRKALASSRETLSRVKVTPRVGAGLTPPKVELESETESEMPFSEELEAFERGARLRRANQRAEERISEQREQQEPPTSEERPSITKREDVFVSETGGTGFRSSAKRSEAQARRIRRRIAQRREVKASEPVGTETEALEPIETAEGELESIIGAETEARLRRETTLQPLAKVEEVTQPSLGRQAVATDAEVVDAALRRLETGGRFETQTAAESVEPARQRGAVATRSEVLTEIEGRQLERSELDTGTEPGVETDILGDVRSPQGTEIRSRTDELLEAESKVQPDVRGRSRLRSQLQPNARDAIETETETRQEIRRESKVETELEFESETETEFEKRPRDKGKRRLVEEPPDIFEKTFSEPVLSPSDALQGPELDVLDLSGDNT